MRSPVLAAALLLAAAAPARGQDALTLADAVAAARAGNPAVRASAAVADEAGERVHQATAGWLPRVDFTESWQRGNLPVYVFSSLLAQRRFTDANFAIDALNHPGALTNYRASLTFSQPIFAADVLSARRAAVLAHAIASTDGEAAERDARLLATTAFGRALVAQARLRAARAAVDAAGEDLRRARERRAAGLVTDADVLMLDVHVAQMRARAIDAAADERIALADLNRTMGRALDREYVLTPLAPPVAAEPPIAALEDEALRTRPEARRARLAEQLAVVQRDAARTTLLPQVSWQGGYEWNGESFSTRARGWLVGAELRLNVFRGLADRARMAEADSGMRRAQAEREAADASIRLDVRSAALRLEAARARVGVGRAAVAQARESQRIIRDRYDTGLAGVSDVLRAAQAVLDSETEATAADADVITGAAALERAIGR